MTKLIDKLRETLLPKWERIPDDPYNILHYGLYVVARFEGDKFMGWAYYARIEGYWGPNNPGCWLGEPTHYMPVEDFYLLLEITRRD